MHTVNRQIVRGLVFDGARMFLVCILALLVVRLSYADYTLISVSPPDECFNTTQGLSGNVSCETDGTCGVPMVYEEGVGFNQYPTADAQIAWSCPSNTYSAAVLSEASDASTISAGGLAYSVPSMNNVCVFADYQDCYGNSSGGTSCGWSCGQ